MSRKAFIGVGVAAGTIVVGALAVFLFLVPVNMEMQHPGQEIPSVDATGTPKPLE